MRKRQRKPVHPGRIIMEHYLVPLNITITELAETLCVSRKALSGIVNEKKSVTADMALRLSKAFDTSPELWWNLQKTYDMFIAQAKSTEWQQIEKINMTLALV